jgi:CHASE3 domain sensor protein
MNRAWSFGRKIGIGFAVGVLLTVIVGWLGIRTLGQVVEVKDRVLEDHARAVTIAKEIEVAAEARISAVRGYRINREPQYLEELEKARARSTVRPRATTTEVKNQLALLDRADDDFRQAQDRVITLLKSNAPQQAIEAAITDDMRPKRLQLYLLTALAALFAAAAALFLTRTLGQQVGAAVGQVQSSSAELQAAASQQATSSREQSTAMTEITTTISEILATSRQIATSAQRVAKMAEQTAGSAKSGDDTVLKAHESITSIQRQVDLIVHHMLDLGKKSQQIGLVLDIVTELAEQTNILSINATIEATAAGDSGRRFAVVADEIRKLADRVGSSTKEIRGLIDEVRSAVNTTVMATETGSKTVEAGSRQFGDVASALRQITGLVSSTTDAAREIELSTQQQSTAVEQVNVAIANVAQASKETEAGSSQTLQTASQLAVLSKELLRLIRPEEAA